MNSDRIEKEVLLKAPLDRVWRAISDADEFGQWFGVRFDGPFVAGTSVTGVITPTTVDEDVAKAQEPHAGQADTWQIVAVEPQRRLAFRWHPFGVEDGVDYSEEPTTLVEFTLEDTSDGVLLRIVESGFEAIPAERRAVGVRGQQRGLVRADRADPQVPGAQREGVSTAAAVATAPLFDALGDPNRLRIITRLCDGGPCSTTKVTRWCRSAGRRRPNICCCWRRWGW